MAASQAHNSYGLKGSEELRFDGQTVVVTGAGGGLGKAYATFFGSRGANVVVNDLGGSFKGEGNSTKAADVVVEEIKKAGGKAVANYDSVENGDRIIDTAIKSFGRIDVLINNAGILRDVSFKNMKDADWDLIMKVHVKGAYKCARAAWPHFRKQKYGRVISTASAAGLFGGFGQTNYSAAKLSQVGFTETLAKEGYKYNILCNIIAPIAASRMTETVMPPDMLESLKPDWIVPLVAVLVHPSNTTETGAIFEAGGGHIAKLRWERAKGGLLRADDSMTPGAVLAKWKDIGDFSEPSYPDGVANFMELLEEAQKLPSNPPGQKVDFKDKVVLITGGGAGLGRSYALLFAKYGAKVAVNDLANPDDVVQEIQKLGGQAIGVKASAEDGDTVVKAVIDAYGRIDVIVNNAGILRDKAFANMDDQQFDIVLNVHLRGTYKITKAAWPYMLKQKYGRIVNTTSTSGIYGNFGQANYAAAKCGILGFSRALAREGAKYNIFVNTIAPNAGTNMTRTIMPEELVQAFKPDYVAPLVVALSSDHVPKPPTGGLFEVGSGWVAKTRWQRSGGHGFPVDVPLTPEAVLAVWDKIRDFDDGRADHPEDTQEGLKSIMANFGNRSQGGKAEDSSRAAEESENENQQYLDAIAAAKKAKAEGTEFVYDDRDIILYNLGLGATPRDQHLIYENADNFSALPTFGVIPPFNATAPFSLSDLVPNFSPMMLLHGEQYLELLTHPIPTEGRILSYPKLVEVIDKGKSAVITTGITSVEKGSKKLLFYNEMTVVVRGAGGFGGPAKPTARAGGRVEEGGRGDAAKIYEVPEREADRVVSVGTAEGQAALYRLSGDRNPLHIDPGFAAVGGFEKPILHGLCSMGVAVKAVVEGVGAEPSAEGASAEGGGAGGKGLRVKSVKTRFVGTVVPGQGIRVELWREGKEGRTVVFRAKVVETGKVALVGGVELVPVGGAEGEGEVKARL